MILAVEQSGGGYISVDITQQKSGHMNARGGVSNAVSDDRRKVGGAGGNGSAESRPEKRARPASESEGPTTSKSHSINKDADDPQPVQPTRTSSRVPKRPRRDMSPPPSPPKKNSSLGPAKEKDAKASDNKTGTPEAKSRRQWEGWSNPEINTFYEALHEHGRDFDAIYNLFCQKHSRRGDASVIKTKDQIRHFYYRTWNKISKYITGVDDVNKHAFELYGLVNYGELRKKMGNKLDEKTGKMLNELIHKGSISVKGKGKYHHRLKTPVCRALRKLNNNLEDPKEEKPQVKVPDLVVVEMVPHTNSAWASVQSMAQNPLLRVKLKPTKKLSDIIDFLNKKWKPHRLRLKENMDDTEEATQELQLVLPACVKLNPFELAPAPAQPRVDITLESYKEMVKNYEETTGHSPSGKRGGNRYASKVSSCDPVEPLDDCAQSAEDMQHKLKKSVTAASQADPAPVNSVNRVVPASEQNNSGVTLAIETEEALVIAATDTIGAKEISSKLSKSTDVSETQSDNVKLVVNSENPGLRSSSGSSKSDSAAENDMVNKEREKVVQEKIQLYKKGWNHKAASEVTIAELYLTMGCPEKLRVEYQWQDIKPMPNFLPLYHNLTNCLRRLVHLAVTEFSDLNHSRGPRNANTVGPLTTASPPSKCTCGAKQSGTPPGGKAAGRSPRVNQSPATPKNSKQVTGAAPKTPVSRKSADCATAEVADQTGVSMNPPAQSAAVVPSSADVVFRVPTSIPVRPSQAIKISPNSLADRHLLQQINNVNQFQRRHEILLPRRSKKLSRCVRRPLVVQKTLLPKTQIPDCQIMHLTMVSQPNAQLAQTGSFMPVLPHTTASLVHGAQPITVGTMAGQSPLAQQMAALATKTRRPQNIVARAAAATLGPDIMGASSASVNGTSNVANLPVNGAQSALPVQFSIPAISSASIHQNSLASSSAASVLTSPSLFNLNAAILQKQAGNQVGSVLATPTSAATGVNLGSGERMSNGASVVARTIVSSPMSMSSLLDLSLPAADGSESTDKLIDLALGNSLGASNTSFSGLLDNSSEVRDGDPSLATPMLNTEISMDGSLMTPTLSPNKSGRAGSLTEVQWLNGEDFSLSQFLVDSPQKKNDSSATINNPSVPPTHLLSESSRDSAIMGRLDVDTALQCMMNENSMDYMAKFADLATQVAACAPPEQTRKADKMGAD